MKKRVFETCNQLVEKGIKPTLITVRTELGGREFFNNQPFRKTMERRKKNERVSNNH
jgi:hypothetical protein